MKQTILTTLLITFLISGLYSQNSPDSVLRDLVNTYRSIDGLSCDIQYKYANSKSPNSYVDSLQGRYIIKGSDVWFEIDQTISIKNNEYSIAIFKEDEIMYVGNATDSKGIHDPLGAIDSLFRYDPDMHSSVKEVKGTWELMLDFPKNALCRNITYIIDKKSGLLLKTISVVSTAMLYDEGAAPKDSQNEFSNIETVFSNYRLGNVNPEVFKTESYLSKQSDELKPAKGFNSYKIIKAKPKL